MTARQPFKRLHASFSWKEVPDALVKAMVVARYEQLGEAGDADRVRKAGPSTARRNLSRAFPSSSGSPAPTDSQLDGTVFEVLLKSWLGRLGKPTLWAIIGALPRDVRRPRRDADAAALREFVRRRSDRPQVRKAIKQAFRRAHKVQTYVTVNPGSAKQASGPLTLQGRAHPQRNPWHEHQSAARARLDELYAAGNFAGRLILPTGAGKTSTAAGWLLDRMAEDPSLRVMWLVHMQSLADQAITTFVDLAEEQETSFTRQARIIHSGASARTTLADEDTDLVALTYHQLRDLEVQEMDLIQRYLQRPTIVVVDEAHHAASTKYERFLDVVEAIETTRALIGLTATPPSTSNARRSFTDRFPTLIHQAGLVELIEQRILARPDVTAIDTGFDLDALTPQQLAAARADDIPAAVLRQLNSAVRNERVVAVWRERKDHWGRTLVFASNIDHADRLQELLGQAGADCRVLHSGVGDRSEILDWFRTHDGEAVLVSVGMLNEGVDLPKAETAFLVRATTSPVLMQQMIGRVLRGPKANGSAEAHIVHFRDNWANLPDVLSPRELLPVCSDADTAREGDRVHPFLDDDELDEMSDIEERLRLQFAQLSSGVLGIAGALVPVAAVRDSRLLGFYRVDELRVPVLDHQSDGFRALMIDAAKWSGERRRPPVLSYFDDSMPPVPPARSLEMIRAVVEEAGEPLELEQLDVVASPRAVAERIVKDDSSAQHRWEMITKEYQRRYVRAAFATLDSFAEAVDREERELRSPSRFAGIERAVPRSHVAALPRLRRAPQREIKPVLRRVADQLHDLVPGSLAASVDRDLDIDWTVRVTGSSFAHWSRKQTGKGTRRETIRVNRLLQAPKRQVGEEILEFLVYHELLHHLLPGNGHDSYFRELEARWPGYENCNRFLDTLHEHFDTRPESYRGA